MKQALKITLITLASLLATIIIAVTILVWIVFTPSKLTPIVNKQAAKYLSCETNFKNVELTFFSTFPSFGLKIDELLLVNPMEDAPTDTLLKAQTITAAIDIMEFLKKDHMIVSDILFEDIEANIFTNSKGISNYDIFISESEDSSAFDHPYELIKVKNLSLKNAQLNYVDLKSKMNARIIHLDGLADFSLMNDKMEAKIKMQSPDIEFSMDTVDYLRHAAVKLELPISYHLNTQKLDIEKTTIQLNSLIALLKGSIQMSDENDDMNTDIVFDTRSYSLKELIKLIPQNYSSTFEGMDTDGQISTTGTIQGVFNDRSIPVIKVNVDLDNGDFAYVDLPMKFSKMISNFDVLLDLNNDSVSNIAINDFSALTGQSKLKGKGRVDQIMLDDMKFDMNIDFNFNLSELEPFMPNDMNMKLAGNAIGKLKTNFMLSDAMDMKVEKMNIQSQFDARRLHIQYDSLSMFADNSKVKLSIPNRKNKIRNFMNLELWSNQLKAVNGKTMAATFQNINLQSETSNIMETDKLNKMLFDFKFDHLKTNVADINAILDKTKGLAVVQMNFSDTVSIPDVSCDFDVAALKVNMDSIDASIKYANGHLKMLTDANNNLVYDIKYKSQGTAASMGKQSMTAQQMAVTANIVYNENETTTMLQWVPNGYVSMTEALITTDAMTADIRLPQIEFSFTPEEYIIKKGKLFIDNSDFDLTGRLWNVNKYLRNEGLLMGQFNFKSETTDVHRLMELTSGLGKNELEEVVEIVEATEADETSYDDTPKSESSSGPYMVPKGMDLKLNAQIDNALLGFENATDITGNIFVKDGLLVLENMRFNTSAAQMQLTAMYKTPRSNHLFVALDYHIMNMEIEELLKMIPDIDTIMPMLRSFGGKGEFHIAAETYTDSMYNIKKSTLRAVSSIKGENLVLMDGETFSEIAKTLRFNKKTVNIIDSLSAEFSIFRNEVDIYPFLIVMDKYKAVVAGRHNLDMNFDYHISVTDSPLPFRLGIDIKGNLDKMKFRPVKAKYHNMYRPASRREIDIKQLEIRKKIREALMSNVIE